MTQFKKVEPSYTGGGIYVFSGQVSNGNYFMAETNWGCVRLLSEEFDLANDEHYFAEWQQPRLIRDLEDSESVSFIVDMLKWVIENKPQGNYTISDMQKDFVFWSTVNAKMICGESFDTATETTNY